MNNLKYILLLLILTFPLIASEKIRVFVLHSYSQEYPWTKAQHNAFTSTLNSGDEDFEFYVEYLDTKRLKLTTEYKKIFLKYLQDKFSTISPNIIYVTDDNALNFIHENYSKLYDDTKNIPVVFSGVNNLAMNEILPKNIFVGVYEVKDIKPNIELIKQFSPQTRDIYIVGDASNTYNSIKKEIQKQEAEFSKMNFHYISDENIINVKKQLPKEQRSFVLLTTIGNFKSDDGFTLLPKESIKKLSDLGNLTILTMEDAYMYNGVIGGYVTSASEQGKNAAILAQKYLKYQSVKDINSLLKSPNLYIFNHKELIKARVLLSEYIRRESIIINKDQDFVEKNKIIIIQILLVIFLFTTFMLSAIYAIQRKKSTQLLEQLDNIETIKEQLHSTNNLLNTALKNAYIGYWKLNIDNDEIFISDELIDILKVDISLYKDDKDFLSYFVHFNDKKLFYNKLAEVKETKEKISFNHRMINSKNQVLNVQHTLYVEKNKKNKTVQIIGIINFDI